MELDVLFHWILYFGGEWNCFLPYFSIYNRTKSFVFHWKNCFRFFFFFLVFIQKLESPSLLFCTDCCLCEIVVFGYGSREAGLH